MKFYKMTLDWLRFQDSREEYNSLDDQLQSLSLDFKNQKIQDMFQEHQKNKIIPLFRICTIFQIIINLSFCINIYLSYHALITTILRGLFTIWLICSLIIQQKSCFKWINKINFFLVLNSFFHIAIFANLYIYELNVITDNNLVAQSCLIAGITQGLFAISYFLICPSWICQSIIVFMYFVTFMDLSQGYKNYKQWYPISIILYLCIVLRMNDKYTKLMFLQVHKQKSNIMACKDIFDQCVPSSIIIVKTNIKEPMPNLISKYDILNESKTSHVQILYANQFAQQYLKFSADFNCDEQIGSIQVIPDDYSKTRSLIDVLTSSVWAQIMKNCDQNVDYALGSEQQILSCSRINQEQHAQQEAQQIQYCDVKLKSCIWEGQQSVIIVLHDTTDRINRIQQLKELNQYKDQLLATVSHNLKTPLNATQLLLFAMKQICKTKKVLEVVDIEILLQNIKDTYLSNCMLITMINDLLDYSQIRKGALRLQIDSFSLDDCIDSVFRMFHRQTSFKKLKLIFQKVNFQGGLILETDQNRLKQILINLVSNSLKFTFEGEITLKINHQEPYIEFTVEDTGIGMPQSVVDKLFQSYATFNLGNKNARGVGLGLVISSKLVGLLGLAEIITVESEQGVGAKFSFRIFRSLIQKKIPPVIDEDYEIHSAQVPKKTRMPLKLSQYSNYQSPRQFQVLIVDDTVFNIQALKAIVIKALDCNVTDFYNGLDAVKSVQSGKRYDLVFMDIEMPIMDGYSATKLIRKYEKEQGIKPSIIFFASAYTIEQEFQRVEESEANELIEKPVQVKKLIDLLKKYQFVF